MTREHQNLILDNTATLATHSRGALRKAQRYVEYVVPRLTAGARPAALPNPSQPRLTNSIKMTNAEKLIDGLVAFDINSNHEAVVMVILKPTMPLLTLKQELTMSMGNAIVKTTLHNEQGRVVYTARDTDPSQFSKAVAAFELITYEASKNSVSEAAKLTRELVDVFGYLESTEADPSK